MRLELKPLVMERFSDEILDNFIGAGKEIKFYTANQ